MHLYSYHDLQILFFYKAVDSTVTTTLLLPSNI